MNTDAIKDELDDIMLDFYKRTARPPASSDRPPIPRIQVDSQTVDTKNQAIPFPRTVTRRSKNSDANPNNSVDG